MLRRKVEDLEAKYEDHCHDDDDPSEPSAPSGGRTIKVEEVEGCDECWLRDSNGWCQWCGHPGAEAADLPRDQEQAPDWCPLRKAPLTIALKESE
jgi:hypothetical protein